MFRDESCKVRARAQRTYKKQSIETDNDWSVSPSSQVSSDVPNDRGAEQIGGTLEIFDRARDSLPWWMGFSIDEVALTHFMSSYIPGSRFEFLPSMYSKLGASLCLPATIEAVSKARLAWELSEPGILESARGSYARALTQTNLALSNPSTATDDSTLVSVLLLSLFETMVWAGTGVPNNWVAHTRGAMALVKLRGKGQFNTEIGLQLFTQVINILSVECIRLRERLPQEIVDLQAEVLEEHTDPIYRVCRYTVELANLVASMAEGNMTTNQVVEETVRMDNKYVAFAESMTLTWGYQTIVLDEDDPEVYGRIVHQYHRPRAAQIWNSIRMTRILLNGVLHGYASLLSSPCAVSILAQAEYNRAQMATHICATVPYFLNPRTFKIASATTLLWPLSSVQGSGLIPQDLKDYAEQSLRRLGQRLRVPGAEVVASEREAEPLEAGLHMFYLT